MTEDTLQNDFVRTELNSIDPLSYELNYSPRHPEDYKSVNGKQYFYADPIIIKEIENTFKIHNKDLLHINFYNKLKKGQGGIAKNINELKFNTNIEFENNVRNVLVLTDDKTKANSIHNEIANLKKLNRNYRVECLDITGFNIVMNKIDL